MRIKRLESVLRSKIRGSVKQHHKFPTHRHFLLPRNPLRYQNIGPSDGKIRKTDKPTLDTPISISQFPIPKKIAKTIDIFFALVIVDRTPHGELDLECVWLLSIKVHRKKISWISCTERQSVRVADFGWTRADDNFSSEVRPILQTFPKSTCM